MSRSGPRIGYVPLTRDLAAPGDRRRFVAYCGARGVSFEAASPNEHYDLVVVTETADITTWCDYNGGRVVFDLIDSFLAVPRWRARQWLRGVELYLLRRHKKLRLDYWEALERMCRRADAVVCATEEQRADIQPHCDNVHIILDIHDAAARRIKTDFTAHAPFRLFWEGLPSNISQLRLLSDVLSRIDRRWPIELHVASDPYLPIWHGYAGKRPSRDVARRAFPKVQFHAWSESSFADVACETDLGIIPVDLTDPFVRGKPENKLLLLWRLGLPVVATATPAYHRTMRAAGIEAFATQTDSDWEGALIRVIEDRDLRENLARTGRAYAETRYSADQVLAKWDRVFASVGFAFGADARA